MKRFPSILGIAVVVAVIGSSAFSADSGASPVRSSIPYVATRSDTVRDMLWMANIGKVDVVYDLGSGDGRIVIAAVRDFKAHRAVGIEIDAQLVRESRENAEKAGVTGRVEFVQGDLFTTDFKEASVVTLFLGHEPNLGLRPKLISLLKPGSRIVSHQFGMGEWTTDKSLTVRTQYTGMLGFAEPSLFTLDPRVPDFTGNESEYGSGDVVLMWIVPAPVAGVWRGTLETAQGRRDVTLTLHQRLSALTGTFQIAGETKLTENVRAYLWGDHLRFECNPEGMNNCEFQLKFDGHVTGNAMRGTLAVLDRGKLRELEWQARRDEVDLTGTWEWTCPAGTRVIGLRIERRDGVYTAAYLDGNQAIPVSDFYDHRGGFYFTLPINHKATAGRGIGDNNNAGWLLCEGIIEDGLLKGTIEFHSDEGSKTSQHVTRNWMPKRRQPSGSLK